MPFIAPCAAFGRKCKGKLYPAIGCGAELFSDIIIIFIANTSYTDAARNIFRSCVPRIKHRRIARTVIYGLTVRCIGILYVGSGHSGGSGNRRICIRLIRIVREGVCINPVRRIPVGLIFLLYITPIRGFIHKQAKRIDILGLHPNACLICRVFLKIHRISIIYLGRAADDREVHLYGIGVGFDPAWKIGCLCQFDGSTGTRGRSCYTVEIKIAAIAARQGHIAHITIVDPIFFVVHKIFYSVQRKIVKINICVFRRRIAGLYKNSYFFGIQGVEADLNPAPCPGDRLGIYGLRAELRIICRRYRALRK